jgi:hypothetical protein
VYVQGDALNAQSGLLTVQVHSWRCLRCTFNTDKGIAAKAKCSQVRGPALFVLQGGEPGELSCCSLQVRLALHAMRCSTESACCAQ